MTVVNFMGQKIEPGALVAFRSAGQSPKIRLGIVRSLRRKVTCEWHYVDGQSTIPAHLAPHIQAVGWNKTKILVRGVNSKDYKGVFPSSSVDMDALIVIDQAAWDEAKRRAECTAAASNGDVNAVAEVLTWQ